MKTFNYTEIYKPRAIEVGEAYWLVNKDTGAQHVATCNEPVSGQKMLSGHWVTDDNYEFTFGKYQIFGPIPGVTEVMVVSLPAKGEVTCRGSFQLGTACGKCKRCVDELAQLDTEWRNCYSTIFPGSGTRLTPREVLDLWEIRTDEGVSLAIKAESETKAYRYTLNELYKWLEDAGTEREKFNLRDDGVWVPFWHPWKLRIEACLTGAAHPMIPVGYTEAELVQAGYNPSSIYGCGGQTECKGSLILGSGCKKCGRCLKEALTLLDRNAETITRYDAGIKDMGTVFELHSKVLNWIRDWTKTAGTGQEFLTMDEAGKWRPQYRTILNSVNHALGGPLPPVPSEAVTREDLIAKGVPSSSIYPWCEFHESDRKLTVDVDFLLSLRRAVNMYLKDTPNA